MTPALQLYYQSTIRKDLVLTGTPSVYIKIVKPTKCVLSIQKFNTDDYFVLASVLGLECVGYQKPYLICSNIPLSKKVIGCKITLRKKNLYNFLFNLTFRVLPQVKQFESFRFCLESNIFSFSIRNVLSFDEVVPAIRFFEDLGCLHCQAHFCSNDRRDVLYLGKSMFLVLT